MASWFNTSSAVPQWKMFITAFQQIKLRQGIKHQNIQFSLQPHQLPSLNNIRHFMSNVSLILNEIKSYNNQMTDFVRINLPLLLKQSIRIILEVPHEGQSQQRKNRFPLQGLEFVEGLMYLPNIFNINYLREDLYAFYCKALLYYFKQNVLQMQLKRNIEEYQNALYKNYFFRLFELPYAVVECETRIGANYASIAINVGTSISVNKKQSFLECLITFLQKNHQTLDLIISNIQSESLLNCLSKIIMTNGMYNYPLCVKQLIIGKLLQVKKRYIELLSNMMNSKMTQKQFSAQRQEMQFKIQNILQIQFNIVNRSSNIYDGIKLFELVANLDNIKDIVYLASVNIVWRNRNSQNKALIPSFVQEHLTELLLSIIHKDTIIYKSSSPTIQIQPKISLKDINTAIQPLLLSLKQLLSEKAPKPQIKHLNLIKILYVMILNRQKYEVLQNIVLKQNILCLMVDICKKNYQMDILVNSILEVFKSIFKGQVNLLILPLNTVNPQQIKNRNEMIEQKIVAQAFKAADLVLNIIKTMKSHKDPLFGQFFKLAKVIKQFARNLFSAIQCTRCQDMPSSSSMSIKVENSAKVNLVLQPLYRNQFIKEKSKEWQDFYLTNFSQLQNNYLRDLGKFDQFEKAPQPSQTQYSVLRCCDAKQVTSSQFIHDKAQFQATIKNSIQILTLKPNQNIQPDQTSQNTPHFNFKKHNINGQQQKGQTKTDKTKTDETKTDVTKTEQNKKQQINKLINSKLLTSQDIEITSQPIKIEFKRKKSDLSQQNESVKQQVAVQQGQGSFQNFMKKKLDQITTQNRQNVRRKSKTPTKFKSTDSKTPPKVKRWGTLQSEQVSTAKNIPKQLFPKQNVPKQPVSKQASLPDKRSVGRSLSQDEKLKKLELKILQKKPLPIKIILVGKKIPKVYKQRDIDLTGRDSRLMQWIRG